MIGALTGKKTLDSILGTFTKTMTELDKFIQQLSSSPRRRR